MSAELATRPDVGEASEAPPAGLWRRVISNPLALASLIFLALVIAAGLLAPVLAPFPPQLSRLELTNVPAFGSEFLLGGDQSGRDILSRLLYATVGTLRGSAVLLVVAVTIGVSTGLVAGYFGGIIDQVFSWLANVILTLPGFVLLIALYTLIGPMITVSMAVFGLLVAPGYFWLVRSLVLSVRAELYVDAAKVAGLTDARIVSRHVLRAVRGPVIVQSSFVLAAGIGIQAGLEFLGLGDPSGVSWGGMLNDAFNNIYVAPMNLVWPSVLISLTTLALVLLGNVVRDTLQTSGSRHLALKPSVVQRLREKHLAERSESGPPAPKASPTQADTPLLEIHDLVAGYPISPESVHPVVKGVNLVVRRGEIHGLVGESGSGKSQIAFSVLGILPKEAVVLGGQVLFSGRDLLADPEALKDARGRRIAYVPQEPMSNLDPSFTVGQQLVYGMRAVKDISRKAAKKRLVELLDRVGIHEPEKVFDLYPHQVSGGMAQRVLIAGALAGDPDLIIADEPTTALDVTVQADVLELLRDLQQERELGMIFVTHNLGVVADLCDRVSVMKEGEIVESKLVDELFNSPEHEYTRMLLDSAMDDVEPRTPLDEIGEER